MKPSDPHSTDPTGAPSPFDRQKVTESARAVHAVGGTPSPAAACDRLIEAANACGGEDNISAVVVWMQ